MNPRVPDFGDFFNETQLHPLGAAVLVVLGLLTFIVPRRAALAPMIVLACFVSPGQRIAIAGIDFDFLRIITLCGWARVLLRREYAGFSWKPLDLWIALWGVSGIFFFTMLKASFEGFIFKLGAAGDAVAMYFLYRMLVRDMSDVLVVARYFALVSIPVALCFIIEHQTARNFFAIFGGVPEITSIRDGRLRCQGAFAHAILAGVFWATLAPVVGILFLQRSPQRRWLGVAGVISTLVIVIMCSSSTPIFALGIGVAGMALFPLRRYARPIFFACLGAGVLLHLVMKQPIWHLLARVSAVSGSTGWHRFRLIDECIRHFNEWWLMGTPDTFHWGQGLQDVTNQFILEAIQGGVVTLILFIIMLGGAFLAVGRRIRVSFSDPGMSIVAWVLGVSLAMHVASFIGVSYFGQIRMLWCLLLALIAAIDPFVRRTAVRRAPHRVPAARRASSSHRLTPTHR